MSHHLDSPIARADVRLDITDLYVFRGEVGTALIINVCHSIAGKIPTPGFHPEGMYEFKVDRTGDAIEDITYRFKFSSRDKDGKQIWTLHRLMDTEAIDSFATGALVLEGETGKASNAEDGTRVWTGQAGDPFWIDPDVLHAVGHAFQNGTTVGPPDGRQARNLFAGHTVFSIVLEVPDKILLDGVVERNIGVWAVASLATDAGGWRSINRIGLPMIHPLFTQFDEDLGNRLNAGNPREDFETYGETIVRSVAGVVQAYGSADDARAYATRVAHRLLPNILPYTIGTPGNFGFVGWNGRSLTDNVSDVMFSLAANTPMALGIGKTSVFPAPSRTFPYVPAAKAGGDLQCPIQ